MSKIIYGVRSISIFIECGLSIDLIVIIIIYIFVYYYYYQIY